MGAETSATPASTSCVFDLIGRYDFLSSKAEEQRDTRRLSHDTPEDANALTQLTLKWKPSGRKRSGVFLQHSLPSDAGRAEQKSGFHPPTEEVNLCRMSSSEPIDTGQSVLVFAGT